MRFFLTAAVLATGFISADNVQAKAPPCVTQCAALNEHPIAAASKEVPEAFVIALLKKYSDGDAPLDQGEDNFGFFSTSTAALIARVDAKGDGPAFDVDPFCDCQDWKSLRVKKVSGSKGDATHAVLRVEMEGDRKFVQTYKLVLEDAGWRVDDIAHPKAGSMLRRLSKR